MQRDILINRVLFSIMLAAVIYLLVMLCSYALYEGYLDHGEPIVAVAAFKMLDGALVYPPFDGPNFTSNVYGPYLYLLNGLFLWILGGSTFSGKISGLAAILLSVVFVWRTYRHSPQKMMFLAVIHMVAFSLLFVPYSIWNRPDPFLVMLVAASVLVANKSISAPQWVQWTILGVLGGVALGLKVYGPLFFIPIGIYVALRDRSFISLLVMSAAGIATAFLPFAMEEFQLANLVAWFSLLAAKPNSGELIFKALRYGVFFLLPMAVLLGQRMVMLKRPGEYVRDPETVYAFLTLIGAGLCVMLAAKPGAGMYYLLPFAPLAIDMTMRIIANVRAENRSRFMIAGGVLVFALLMTAVPVQKRYFRALDWDRVANIKEDLRGIMGKYPGKTIQMAIGSTFGGYHNTLQKSELIYAGNPYTVDFGIMIETSYLGIPLPDAVIDALAKCETEIWLVPRGEKPLTMVGYYGTTVVSDLFRDTFHLHYAHTETSAFFDIWQCKVGSS